MEGFGEATDRSNLGATAENHIVHIPAAFSGAEPNPKYFQHLVPSHSREVLGNFHLFQLSCFRDEHRRQRISLSTCIKCSRQRAWRSSMGELYTKFDIYCKGKEKSKNYCSYTYLRGHLSHFIKNIFPRCNSNNFIFQQITLDMLSWIERKKNPTSNKCNIRNFIYKYTVIQQPFSTQFVEEKVIVTFSKWEKRTLPLKWIPQNIMPTPLSKQIICCI